MMKYYVVMDTNVIVSAFLRWDSVPGKLMDAVFSRKLIPVISKEILKEYIVVLSRGKFSFPKDTIGSLVDFLEKYAVIIEPEATSEIFTDLSDAKFYEVTMEERNYEETFLVTGNLKHFPFKPFIITPREMLDIISKQV